MGIPFIEFNQVFQGVNLGIVQAVQVILEHMLEGGVKTGVSILVQVMQNMTYRRLSIHPSRHYH